MIGIDEEEDLSSVWCRLCVVGWKMQSRVIEIKGQIMRVRERVRFQEFKNSVQFMSFCVFCFFVVSKL